ncbi:MAG: hypothetical protein V2A63_03530, partial [Patescibacteria group bacterium]
IKQKLAELLNFLEEKKQILGRKNPSTILPFERFNAELTQFGNLWNTELSLIEVVCNDQGGKGLRRSIVNFLELINEAERQVEADRDFPPDFWQKFTALLLHKLNNRITALKGTLRQMISSEVSVGGSEIDQFSNKISESIVELINNGAKDLVPDRIPSNNLNEIWEKAIKKLKKSREQNADCKTGEGNYEIRYLSREEIKFILVSARLTEDDINLFTRAVGFLAENFVRISVFTFKKAEGDIVHDDHEAFCRTVEFFKSRVLVAKKYNLIDDKAVLYFLAMQIARHLRDIPETDFVLQAKEKLTGILQDPNFDIAAHSDGVSSSELSDYLCRELGL